MVAIGAVFCLASNPPSFGHCPWFSLGKSPQGGCVSFSWSVEGTVTESAWAPDKNQARKHQCWEYSGSFLFPKVLLIWGNTSLKLWWLCENEPNMMKQFLIYFTLVPGSSHAWRCSSLVKARHSWGSDTCNWRNPGEYKMCETSLSHALGAHSMKVHHLEARESLTEVGTFVVELEGRVGILGQISGCWD